MNIRHLAAAAALAFAVCSAIAAPLAERHQGRGLACDACHTTPPQLKENGCLTCHGGADTLVKRNAVHAAVKNGMACQQCHKAHKE